MAIEYSGYYRLLGNSAWIPIFLNQGATDYSWATAGVPDGTYQIQIEATDTTDNESSYSIIRTIGISHGVASPSQEAVVYEGEVSVDGEAFQRIFFPLGETQFPLDLSSYPNGSTVALRLRSYDLRYKQYSAWSLTRLVTINRAAMVPLTTIPWFSPTRNMTAAERAVLAAEHFDVYSQVQIQDEDGDWRDVSALGGSDFLRGLKVSYKRDQSVYSFSVELSREVLRPDGTKLSLAPTMSGSEINRKNNGTYSPFLRNGAAIRVYTSTFLVDDDPSAMVMIGDGFMGDPEWGTNTISLECQSRSSKLAHAPVMDPKKYGSASGTPLADVVRQQVADAGSTDTLVVVGDLDWSVLEYTQQAGPSRLEAITTAALQNGSMVQDRFTSRLTSQLALFHPPRLSVLGTPDLTFGPEEYETLSSFKTNSDSVRNLVRIAYLNRTTGKTELIEEKRQASIDLHGLRPMQLALTATSNIDTEVEARALANYILDDLAEPYLVVRIKLSYFWGVDLGAVVQLNSNNVHHDEPQKLVVTEIDHDINENVRDTFLTLQGRMIGNYRLWLNRQAPNMTNMPLVVEATSVRIAADELTYNVKLGGTVTRNNVNTGEIPQVAMMALDNGVSILEGPPLGVYVAAGTVWTLSRPSGKVPGSYVFRAKLPSGEYDEDREAVFQQGVSLSTIQQLRWQSFELVREESDDLISYYRGVLVDPHGAATGPATVTLTRTGANTDIIPVTSLEGALPLTIEFRAPRQPFQTGESIVEAYGVAPGIQGEWQRIGVAAVEQDTQTPEFAFMEPTVAEDYVVLWPLWKNPRTGLNDVPDSYTIIIGEEFDISSVYYATPGFNGEPWVVERGVEDRTFAVLADKPGFASVIATAAIPALPIVIPPPEEVVVLPEFDVRAFSDDGTGYVVITPRQDVQARVSRVEYEYQQGTGTLVGPVVDLASPFETNIVLIENKASRINWRAFGTDVSGNMNQPLGAGSVTFPASAKPATPTIKMWEDKDGYIYCEIIGDANTKSIDLATSYTATPPGPKSGGWVGASQIAGGAGRTHLVNVNGVIGQVGLGGVMSVRAYAYSGPDVDGFQSEAAVATHFRTDDSTNKIKNIPALKFVVIIAASKWHRDAQFLAPDSGSGAMLIYGDAPLEDVPQGAVITKVEVDYLSVYASDVIQMQLLKNTPGNRSSVIIGNTDNLPVTTLNGSEQAKTGQLLVNETVADRRYSIRMTLQSGLTTAFFTPSLLGVRVYYTAPSLKISS